MSIDFLIVLGTNWSGTRQKYITRISLNHAISFVSKRTNFKHENEID